MGVGVAALVLASILTVLIGIRTLMIVRILVEDLVE